MRIIAECGCNWKDIEDAQDMINKCREVGVDLVKFQLFSPEYAKANKIPPHLSLSFEDAELLYEHGQFRKQEVFFTPFDVERVDWCAKIGVKWYKVRHADRFNLHLIQRITNLVWGNGNWFVSIDGDLGSYLLHHAQLMKEMGREFHNLLRVDHPLICIPRYPAPIHAYLNRHSLFGGGGISDHTPDLKLLKIAKILDMPWVEKHVKLREDCLEAKWSVFIDDLGEVING